MQKIAAPQHFADSIASFQIVPNAMVNLAALGLPFLECILGIAVLTGFSRRPALLGIGGLTLLFILALASTIVRGIPVDCGCLGGSGEPSIAQAWKAIARDLPILAAAVWMYCRGNGGSNSASMKRTALP